jgi:DNA-binding MarR family transcriptional regulator
MGTESPDAIAVIELELMKLVRHLETLGRRSSLYERVDRAGYLAMRMLDGLGPVSTNTLARALRLDASTVTRQLTVLEGQGFVQRCANPADGRSSTIVLTPEGRQCMCDVQRERWQHIGELVSDWPEREQCDLGTALTRLNVSLADRVARLGKSAAHDAASAQARSSAWENTSADCAPETP